MENLQFDVRVCLCVHLWTRLSVFSLPDCLPVSLPAWTRWQDAALTAYLLSQR